MGLLRCECFITARDKFGHFYSDGGSRRPGSPFGQIEINAKHAAWTKLVLADPFRPAWNYLRGCVRSGSIHFFGVRECGVHFRIWNKLSEVGMKPNGLPLFGLTSCVRAIVLVNKNILKCGMCWFNFVRFVDVLELVLMWLYFVRQV